MKHSIVALILGITLVSSQGASMNEMDHGPFVSWTIRGEGDSVTYKGIAIRLDETAQASVCFDTDLLRYSAAWTGGFLQWYPERDGLERNPTIQGTKWFDNEAAPGWSTSSSFTDPRELPYGPLPKEIAHYKGLYRTASGVVISYTVGDRSILEKPSFRMIEGEGYFVREFEITPGRTAPVLRVARVPGKDAHLRNAATEASFGVVRVQSEAQNRLVGFVGLNDQAEWALQDEHLCLHLPASNESQRLAILQGYEPKGYIRTHRDKVQKFLQTQFPLADLRAVSETYSTRWDETLETPTRLGNPRDALAIDTFNVPQQNPWNSWIRFGGLDFLDEDQAILGNISGDVWLVSGLRAGSPKTVWKRFATGLYQPLGVKIVDGQIYVLGRDQITRLHDYDGNGEADYYENFNNDSMVAENFHSFTLNLETDSEGNFYYAQGAPWPPDVKTPHQGILFRVSPDGKQFESYADGLRGPNGMAIGPNDIITYSDNEGHWLPTCSLQLVRKGGFHGMRPTAHLHDEIPDEYEKPICWIPRPVDNSPGDQIWINSENWGPLNGKLLMTSYGKSSVSLVLTQEVNGTLQGGTVKLPLKFRSGLIRGRLSQYDDHLYVCGISNWQTTGVIPGGFYRIRYTGQPLNAPVDLKVDQQSIHLTFSDALDPDLATDPESYNIEQWNYRWIERYGSPHYSVQNPDEEGQDTVPIRKINLSDDGKTVRLVVDQVVPVMQMMIAYNLESTSGDRLRHEIYSTIHEVP